ncbi:hypothetical protein ABGB09_21930 [Streptomyces sp. B8F3]|uniref:hypothetical protein n=1 Tax=Streptomyces sp. B8F3 TaxID=3153573 RepID=UPI00325E230B
MPEKDEKLKYTTKGNARPTPPTDEPDPNQDPTVNEPTKDDDSNGDLKPLGNARP